jgi:hypothetical protein
MNNKEHIDKMVEEALNSVEGAGRAAPKPFLLTRINARLNATTETAWERAGRFIARPAIVIAGLCMVIGINALVVAYNNNSTAADTTMATNQQAVASDEFSTNIAKLYDIENTEP